jgi:hypothetical protein
MILNLNDIDCEEKIRKRKREKKSRKVLSNMLRIRLWLGWVDWIEQSAIVSIDV